jgi:glyoxylase-like metal-dependent hydrolase (beta-lactamase superfamily II)/ferredoxin
MAHVTQRRAENVAGDFYVDTSCIDCDTCRWMAPVVFDRVAGQSAVVAQPQTKLERQAALEALLSCPTASIGTTEPPKDIKAVQQLFPLPIAPTVYHCGYHSERSYGATSYLIQHPEGNILVDSPRFAPPLIKQLEVMGGVKYLYLTHRDDVADHERFHEHFGCDRLLHTADLSPNIGPVEHPLEGSNPIPFLSDVLIIPVPGHSPGHTVLLYGNEFLFTGDHLAWSARNNSLTAFRDFCWYSWPTQIESMRQLLDYDFTWVLPGHGRRHHAPPTEMKQALEQLIVWMDQNA